MAQTINTSFTRKQKCEKSISYLLTTSQEQAIPQFHNVCLVNRSNFLSLVFRRVVERELGNALAVFAGDHFEAFHHSLKSRPFMKSLPNLCRQYLDGLVLERRIFSFDLLSDDDGVDIFVFAASRQRLDVDHVGVEIEFLSQLHIKSFKLSGAAVVRRRQNSLEANSISGYRGGHFFQRGRQLWMNFAQEKPLKVDGNSCSLKLQIASASSYFNLFYLEDFNDRIKQFRADAIAGN